MFRCLVLLVLVVSISIVVVIIIVIILSMVIIKFIIYVYIFLACLFLIDTLKGGPAKSMRCEHGQRLLQHLLFEVGPRERRSCDYL